MRPENIACFVEEVADAYPNATRSVEANKTYLRIQSARLPAGCSPAEMPVLVVLEPGQTPLLLTKTLPKLANGKEPRSCSPMTVAGEAWYTFSFAFKQAWDENRHTAVQFIEGRLRRFALNE